MAEASRTKNTSGKSHDQRSAGTNTELFGFYVSGLYAVLGAIYFNLCGGFIDLLREYVGGSKNRRIFKVSLVLTTSCFL